MSNPGREHWEAVKWLLRYLKGISKATLCFSRKEVVLEGFSYSDYGGCLDLGKSTTEVEYMAIAEASKKLSAIHLANNPVFHGQTKHIKIRYHYIRELVSEGTLSLMKIHGAKNPADMFTKVGVLPEMEVIPSLMMLVQDTLLRAEGSRLRAEGSDVDLMKRSEGRTLHSNDSFGGEGVLGRLFLLVDFEEDDAIESFYDVVISK
ncbi:hypothetical protein Tco_1159090, partial [Tanacetum coccineum]